MNPATPREALDSLLEGDACTASQLDTFIELHAKEGQHHDFKDGLLLQDLKGAGRIIREYVGAFANAEGGLLIVGVKDGSERQVSPCKWGKQIPLDKWAEDLVHDMAPFLSPLPRFYVVDHTSGSVLVIAVPRAPGLVPCVERRELKYFLRLNQSTLEIPAFLLTDLVLGRRRQPSLKLNVRIPRLPTQRSSPLGGEMEIRPLLYFSVENTGLVHADRVELGMVAWSKTNNESKLYGQLRSYIDSETPNLPGPLNLQHRLIRHPSGEIRIPPFCDQSLPNPEEIRLPVVHAGLRSEVAIYVLAEGAPPAWFQLTFEYPDIANTETRRGLSPLLSGRPRVTCSVIAVGG